MLFAGVVLELLLLCRRVEAAVELPLVFGNAMMGAAAPTSSYYAFSFFLLSSTH